MTLTLDTFRLPPPLQAPQPSSAVEEEEVLDEDDSSSPKNSCCCAKLAACGKALYNKLPSPSATPPRGRIEVSPKPSPKSRGLIVSPTGGRIYMLDGVSAQVDA